MRLLRSLGLLHQVIRRVPDYQPTIDPAVRDCQANPRFAPQMLPGKFLSGVERFLRTIAWRLFLSVRRDHRRLGIKCDRVISARPVIVDSERAVLWTETTNGLS